MPKKERTKDELAALVEKAGLWANDQVTEWISTSFPELDEKLGGGFPVGRTIEIYGDESAGKTNIAFAIAGQFLREGKKVLHVDLEDSYDKNYAEKIMGISSENLYVIRGAETGEQTLGLVMEAITKNLIDLIIIDSLSEVYPSTWLENGIEQAPIGRKAKLHGSFLYTTRNDRILNDISMIILSQTRAPIGDTGLFLTRKSTSATQLLHEFKVRLRASRGPALKSKEENVGYVCKVEIKKNKVGPMGGSVRLHYLNDIGFYREWDLLEYYTEKGVIKKEGANYSFNGERFAYGEMKAVEALKDPEFLQKVKEALV